MPLFRTMQAYAVTNTAGVLSDGVATNASWVGPWINVEGMTSIAWQAILTATGSPTGVWGCDVTDDERLEVNSLADSALRPGVTPIVLSTAQLAENPNGTTTARNYHFQFDPSPRAKWARFKLTISGGGSASQLLKVGFSGWGA